MRAFIGITLWLGVKGMDRPDAWLPLPTGDATAQKTFYERRFVDLLSCFHLLDNDEVSAEQKKADCFWQVRPLIDALNRTFPQYYFPCQDLSVDEITTPQKGRHRGKMYNKDKPIKWGFKTFALAGGKGYILRFFPYQGKDQSRPEDQGLGEWAVRSLLPAAYDNKNHIVTADNYFTCAALLKALRSRGYHAIGTTRNGRKGQPTAALLSNTSADVRGHLTAFEHKAGELFVYVWKDSKDVRIMSTFPCPIGTVQRKVKATAKAPYRTITVPIPANIKYYNLHMNGVDINDQMTAYFRPTIRTRRATRNYLIHMLQLVAVNTKIIFQDLHPPAPGCAAQTTKRFVVT